MADDGMPPVSGRKPARVSHAPRRICDRGNELAGIDRSCWTGLHIDTEGRNRFDGDSRGFRDGLHSLHIAMKTTGTFRRLGPVRRGWDCGLSLLIRSCFLNVSRVRRAAAIRLVGEKRAKQSPEIDASSGCSMVLLEEQRDMPLAHVRGHRWP